ncbi:MAG TPA: ABC transporter permease [Kofleriaceae bacterium]|nr:ABC transporter permease [Kofleriaceae bacterium]
MKKDDRRRREWRTPAEVTGEVRAEIESHIALHAADLVARGWTREAAAEEALRRFGDRARIEREVIDMDRRELGRARRRGVAADLVQDARLAVRHLRRQPGAALAAILVIGLGVGAGASVFGVVDAALFRPLPFADGDELVYLFDVQPVAGDAGPSLPELRDWEREADFLGGLMAVQGGNARWRSDAGWEVMRAGFVTGDVRRVIGRDPLLGRWFSAEELRTKASVAVLDEHTWRERFGGHPDVIGSQLHLEKGVHTIIGVAPGEIGLLRGSDARGTAVWLPLREADWMVRGTHFLSAIGRLAPGVTLESAAVRAELLGRQIQATGVTTHGVQLRPAREVLVGDVGPMLLALGGAALFVLLAVCANLGNLFLWKSLARGREFTVRAALGASRGRMIRQVLTESAVLGLLGGLCGLVVSDLLLHFTRAVVSRAGALAPGSSFDGRIIAFSVVLSLLVGVAFGLWPALRASRTDLAGALKQDAAQLTTSAASPWRRKVLVATEIALSIMLVAGTGLLVRSLARMLGEDPGFAPGGALAFRVTLPESQYDEAQAGRFAAELRRRAAALPGVVAFGAASELPLQGRDTSGDFEVVGRQYAEGSLPVVKKRIVGPGYFDALGIPVLRGRDLRDSDREGAPDVLVISQSVARRHFPGEDAVGKRIRFNWGPGDEQEIVGVVGDVRHDGLDRPFDEILYRPFAQMPHRGPVFVVRSAIDPVGLAGAIRREIARIDPNLAMSDVSTMDDIVSQAIAPRRSLIVVLGGFALIAALLAAVGAYAVTSQMVALRTREIGLRMAVGAQPGDILRLMLREGAVMIGLGAAGGLLGALAATRVLAGMLYGVSPHDPVTLGAAMGLLAAIAAVAIYLPSRRAARTDPMLALRSS